MGDPPAPGQGPRRTGDAPGIWDPLGRVTPPPTPGQGPSRTRTPSRVGEPPGIRDSPRMGDPPGTGPPPPGKETPLESGRVPWDMGHPPGKGDTPPPPWHLAWRGPRRPGWWLQGYFQCRDFAALSRRVSHPVPVPPQPHPVTTATPTRATRTQPRDRRGPAALGDHRGAGSQRMGPLCPRTWCWGQVCPQGHCPPPPRGWGHICPQGHSTPRPADGNMSVPRSLAPLGGGGRGHTSVPKATVTGPRLSLAQGHPGTGRSLGGHWAGTRGHCGPWEP